MASKIRWCLIRVQILTDSNSLKGYSSLKHTLMRMKRMKNKNNRKADHKVVPSKCQMKRYKLINLKLIRIPMPSSKAEISAFNRKKKSVCWKESKSSLKGRMLRWSRVISSLFRNSIVNTTKWSKTSSSSTKKTTMNNSNSSRIKMVVWNRRNKLKSRSPIISIKHNI